MLGNLLQRCGLNQSEQDVLIVLLLQGPLPAARIARASRLKRPTVYAALNNLMDLGLVMREKRGSLRSFRSVSRQAVPNILERQAARQFEEVRTTASLLAAELKSLPEPGGMNVGGFKIGTIDSSEAVYAHLEEVLNRGDFAAIFDPQLIPEEQRQGVVKRFLENTAKSRPRIREIATKGPATTWYKKHIRNRNHEVKELPPTFAIRSDVILLDGEVVVSNYEVNSELAVRIQEPNLYTTLLTMFDLIWERLP